MRESVGTVSIFQIVIVFLFIFVAIMCFTFNHSKAFAVKDEIITILESDSLASYNSIAGTISATSAESIASELTTLGYHSTGTCPSGYTGYDANGSVVSSGNALFCIRAVDVTSSFTSDAESKCSGVCTVVEQNYPTMVYYDVALFYTLDIPILKTILNLNVKGSTKVLYGS